jgi:ATP-dependent Clp protease adapter protein ClpS
MSAGGSPHGAVAPPTIAEDVESTFMVRKLAELSADPSLAGTQALAERLLALAARPPFEGAEAEPSFLQPENLGLSPALDRLLCMAAGASPADPEEFFASLAQGSDQTRCGRLFASNEIVYRCSTCGVDPTCVMCARCFDAKAHDGHEVMFYSSSGRGGCCDGGDPEAWVATAPAILRGIKKQTTDEPELPAPVAAAASQLFRACFGFTLRLLSDTLRGFEPGAIDSWDAERGDASASPWAQESSMDTQRSSFRVRLHNDDVHTFEDVIDALQRYALPPADARAPGINVQAAREIATAVHTAGSSEAWSGDIEAARPVVEGLRDEGLLVSVAPRWAALPKRSAIAVVLVGWVHRIAQTSKKLAALAGVALLEEFAPLGGERTTGLALLVQHNDLLDVKLVQALHDMYLALFAAEDDQLFRRHFGLTFVRAYRAINARWTSGIGTQEESVFGLAVQLLTVPSMLPILQQEVDVLGTLLLSLRDMLQATQATVVPVPDRPDEPERTALDLTHHCFRHSRYRHIVQDMVHVLRCNASMPMILVSRPELLGYWCDSLALVQGVAVETRQAGAHVEYENEHWVSAFELTWSLTQMSHDIISAIYGAVDKLEDDEPRAAAMRTIGSICCDHLTAWVDADGTAGGPYDVATQPVTFHLPLSRALAIALRRSCTSTSGSDTVGPASLLPDGFASQEQIFRLIEHPLRTSVFAAQVQVGMWKRNGAAVAHEAVNYAGTNNRVLMADLDLTILQLGAARGEPDAFLTALFDRFAIQQWATGAPAPVAKNEDDKLPEILLERQKAMAEECLVLIIQILNELPRSPALPASAGLRRELLHRLCAVGDTGCSHARLSECARIARRQTMVESDFFSPEQVDAEIAVVAEFKENADPMQPGKYVLQESSVLEYDPHYFHLNRNEHEQARDWIEGIRKKARDLDQPRPCVQAPSEPHAFYTNAFRLLEATPMLVMWRQVLLSAIAVTAPAGEDSAPAAEKPASAVTDGIIDASLQLVTMAVHCQRYLPIEDEARRPLYAAMAADPPDGAPCLLLLLHQLQTQVAEENPSLSEAIAWIVAQLVESDGECAQKLRQVTGAASPTNKTSLEERRKQLKQEAQRRAMADMQKMQMSFMEGMDSDSSDEDDMVLVNPVTSSEETGAATAATAADGGGEDDTAASLPECALSHEASQTDRLVGMMAFAQRSCVASGFPMRGGICVHFYGHALHFDRYDTYYVSLVDKMEQNQPYEGMHSIDVDRGEFLSPVCKSICNLLVPAVVNGAASIRAAAAVATEAIGEVPEGVASWLHSGFETAYDGCRDADAFPVDSGVCSAEHVARMLSSLYDLTKRSASQKNTLTLLEVGSEAIAYSIEAREMCRAEDGAATPLWPELQLRQTRTMFDGIRAYAAHRGSESDPLIEWARVQVAGLMLGAPRDGGWCGLASSASAWLGSAPYQANSTLFDVGDQILIHGLRSPGALPHNGKRGQIERYDESKGRFNCRIDGKVLGVKPTNLLLCCSHSEAPAHLLEADLLRLLGVCAVHATSRAYLLHLARCFYVARLAQAVLEPDSGSTGEGDAGTPMDADEELVPTPAVSCETAVLICSIAEDDGPPCSLTGLREACLPFLRRAIMLVNHVALRLGDELAPVGSSTEEEYAWCAQQLGTVAPGEGQPEPELELVKACRATVEK